MEHVNGWCFRGIYKGGLWEDDLHVSAQLHWFGSHTYIVIGLKHSIKATALYNSRSNN